MKKPLLLYNEAEMQGPLVRMVTPCEVQADGLQEGDLVKVAAFNSEMICLGTQHFNSGNGGLAYFDRGVWFQASRLKSVGSRVNVFASTK